MKPVAMVASPSDIAEERERLALIAELIRIDPNGEYSDADSLANGWEPLTLAEARDALASLLADGGDA